MKTKKRRKIVSRTKKTTTRVTVDLPTIQHRKLKALASLEGVTMQEYIRSRIFENPSETLISDKELSSIAKEIINENTDALKRLANK